MISYGRTKLIRMILGNLVMSNQERMCELMRTLFGNESVTAAQKKTVRNAFRKSVGYDRDHKCKNCKKFVEWPIGNRKVYKCRLLQNTSKTSDIKINEVACRFFEESNEGRG